MQNHPNQLMMKRLGPQYDVLKVVLRLTEFINRLHEFNNFQTQTDQIFKLIEKVD